MAYRIFTDATFDLNDDILQGLPSVTVIPMQVEIDGKNYTYGPNGDITSEQFYALQRMGYFATTSQISPQIYREAFEPCLQDECDILYLCFSSGLSGTIQSANLCIGMLRERYPARRIVCVDTLCASIGEGLLVLEAARKQADGVALEELSQWVESFRLNVDHWFTVDVFDHLRHGGRVSSAAAVMGTMLQIKPLLHVNQLGMLEVSGKPRGQRRAMEAQLTHMTQNWMPSISKTVMIGHGDCPEKAEQLANMVREHFPEADIRIMTIGPVIGAHTGPGMLALIYWSCGR